MVKNTVLSFQVYKHVQCNQINNSSTIFYYQSIKWPPLNFYDRVDINIKGRHDNDHLNLAHQLIFLYAAISSLSL